VVHGPPQVVPLTVDLHKNLVQMPPPAAGFHSLDAPLFDLCGEHWAEPVPPEPDGLVAHVDATLMQQVFDVPQRKRKPHEQHHSKTDDLRTGFEVAEWGAFYHLGKL